MNKQQKQEIEEWREKVARQEKAWNEFIEAKIKELAGEKVLGIRYQGLGPTPKS